jgi:hypothetical protein
MYDEGSFKAAVHSLYDARYRPIVPRWYRLKSKETEIDKAWKLYTNARNNDLSMLILGGKDIRSDTDLLANLGTTANAPVTNPSGQFAVPPTRSGPRGPWVQPPSASNRTGSVLNDKGWWPLQNDAWVLGGVHGLSQFHMASPGMPPDDELWDASKGYARVLGRELIGLFAFGYIRVQHDHEDKLGLVLAPNNKQAATEATFAQYLDAVLPYINAAQITNKLANSKDYSLFAMPV